jgi:hypothetical protein
MTTKLMASVAFGGGLGDPEYSNDPEREIELDPERACTELFFVLRAWLFAQGAVRNARFSKFSGTTETARIWNFRVSTGSSVSTRFRKRLNRGKTWM